MIGERDLLDGYEEPQRYTVLRAVTPYDLDLETELIVPREKIGIVEQDELEEVLEILCPDHYLVLTQGGIPEIFQASGQLEMSIGENPAYDAGLVFIVQDFPTITDPYEVSKVHYTERNTF